MSTPQPKWRKVLVSGSNAHVAALTASAIANTHNDSESPGVEEKVLVYNTSSGAIYYTGSFGTGGSGGGGTPASPNQSVQFNNSGDFGGNSGFIFDSSQDASLFVSGAITGSIIVAQDTEGSPTPAAISVKDVDGNAVAQLLRVGGSPNTRRGRLLLMDSGSVAVEITTNGVSYISGSDGAGVSAGFPKFGIGTRHPSSSLTVVGGVSASFFTLASTSTFTAGLTQEKVGGSATLESTTADSSSGNQATRFLLRGNTDNADIEFYTSSSGSETLMASFAGDPRTFAVGDFGTGATLDTNVSKSKLIVDGNITTTGSNGNITASGEISASSKIYANQYIVDGQNVAVDVGGTEIRLSSGNRITKLLGQSILTEVAFTGSAISASGNLFISTSLSGSHAPNNVVLINTATGELYHTGSYGSGGGTGGGVVTAITNNTNDNVLTATGGTTINGEAALTFNTSDGLRVAGNAFLGYLQNGSFGGNAAATSYKAGQFVESSQLRTYVTPQKPSQRMALLGVAIDRDGKVLTNANYIRFTSSIFYDPTTGGGGGHDPDQDDGTFGTNGRIQVADRNKKTGITLSGNPGIYFFNNDASASVSGSFSFDSASAHIKFDTGSSGVQFLTGETTQTLTQTLFLSQSSGNPSIGVGTTTPLSTLDVRSVTSSAPANIILRTNEDGVIQVGEETGRIEFAIESASFLGTGFIVSGSTAAMFSRVVESSPVGAIGNLILSVNEASALTPVEAVTIGKGATPGFSGIGMAVSGNIDVSSTAPLIKVKNDNGTTVARLGFHSGTDPSDGQLLLFNQGVQSVLLNGDESPADASFIKFGNFALGGTTAGERLTVEGNISASGKIITTEVESPSDFTLDVEGDITLDANGADIILSDDGTDFGRFKRDTSNFVIKSETNNKDIIFKGVDDSSTITALTLDMSDAGKAIFNSDISASGDVTADRYFLQGTRILSNSGTEIQINETTLPIHINGPSIGLEAPVTASIISASGTVTTSGIVSSGDIHLSTNNTQITQVLSTGATRDLIGFDASDNAVVGNPTANKVKLEGDVTASANISASGDLFFRSRTIAIPTTANGYSGDVVSFGSGPSGNDGNINAGELYYLDSSQNWELADADAAGTATNMLGIAVADNTPTFLVKGIIVNNDYGGFTTGTPLYVSTTAGDITSTAPSGTGDIVRVVGYSVNGGSRTIYFNPSNDHIVHA